MAGLNSHWRTSLVFWTLVFSVGAIANSCSNYLERKGIENAEVKKLEEQRSRLLARQETLDSWTRKTIPEVSQAIQTLEAQRETWSTSIQTLKEDLATLGFSPYNDPDVRAWEKELEAINRELASLRKSRESAYIQFRKMSLRPAQSFRDSQEESLANLIDRANSAASSATQRFSKISSAKTEQVDAIGAKPSSKESQLHKNKRIESTNANK